MQDDFKGFPPEALDFFRQLRENNNRDWFEAHREDYDRFVLDPSRAFVEALGRRLLPVAPQVHADPRVNKSLFRIHRDTRFSQNKAPYKTHLAILLWEGRRTRMQSASFYFHVDPDSLFIGAGIYCFDKGLVGDYRNAVDDSASGEKLQRIASEVEGKGYRLGGQTYKRVPAGFAADHPRADLLKHSGLYGYKEAKPPKTLHTNRLPDWCLKHYLNLLPLHQWLKKIAD